MSSSTSPQHDRMLAQQRAHEPSMEEILASIRRIIADDGQAARAEAPPVAEPPRPESPFRPAAVRESAFTEALARPAPAETVLAPNRPANVEPASFAPRAPRAENFEALSARLGAPRGEETATPVSASAPARAEAFDVGEAIVQAVTDDLATRPLAVASPQPVAEAPAMLSREADAAVAAQFGKLSEALLANNAQRLDEMTRQMLRPLLKSWLDDNLPVLVERLVRAEIERVARGGR